MLKASLGSLSGPSIRAWVWDSRVMAKHPSLAVGKKERGRGQKDPHPTPTRLP